MHKDDNKIALHFPAPSDGKNTMTVLTGDAPKPLLPPAKLGYAGRLDTPRLFLTPKEANYTNVQCTFEVDAENNRVRFVGTEKSHESVDVITGTLTPSAALAEFEINTGARWTISKLVELVKRMRPYFASQDAQVALIKRLKNWEIGVTKLFEEVQGQDGSARRAVTIKVEGTAPDNFKLCLPIYKGYPKQTFEVEFGVDAEGGGVKLYMDSPELMDLLLTTKEEYINTEVEYFKGFGCSVIYVS